VNRIRIATAAALVASFVTFQPASAIAQRRDRDRDRRDRYEEQWERRQERLRREARREWREERREAREEWRERQREAYWDAARSYRQDDRRYGTRRMSRYDRIYRGSDNRYYCDRDDGTTGLIIGGVAGAVLGNIITPGESKVLGTIIGGGAGALIGRAIDDGDIVCR
jgi:hypothetical protein